LILPWSQHIKNPRVDLEKEKKQCSHYKRLTFQQPQPVPDLDKERPYAIALARPLPIPHLHDWRKMEVVQSISIKAKMMRGV
jgi:hypothetical protein